jgi:hypothetical protein
MGSILKAFVAAVAVAPMVTGHTWIEQLRNVNEKGQYVGEYGYPRGMKSKTDPGYNGDAMNWELPAQQKKVFIDETTPLCHTAQTKQVQSSQKYPRLQAVAGGFVAMRYMENGHVTLVDPATGLGKPEHGGTVFVYGTTEPLENEKLVNVLHWTKDGKGGDKRGVLLATNDFDDGRCYEVNNTPTSQERRVSDPNFAMGQAGDGPGNYPLFCETNVQVPKTAAAGKPYTFYWVWQWNTAPGVDPGLPTGKDQYYTTCMDVDVTSASRALTADSKHKYALGPQQDAMSIAVSDFASRTALVTDPAQGEVGPVFTGKPSNSVGKPKPTASGAPFGNSTGPAPTRLPTLSTHLGPAPTQVSSGVIIVTDTVFITVTASAVTASAVPPAAATISTLGGFGFGVGAGAAYMTPRAAAATPSIRHKNGAKFRGRFASANESS